MLSSCMAINLLLSLVLATGAGDAVDHTRPLLVQTPGAAVQGTDLEMTQAAFSGKALLMTDKDGNLVLFVDR